MPYKNIRKNKSMKYSLCITTPEVKAVLPLAMLRGSFMEKTVKASNYGYAGVELMTVEPLKVDASFIRDSLLSGGLAISAVSSGAVLSTAGLSLLAEDEKTRAAAGKRLSELIQFAGRTGAKIVTIGSFRGRASSVGGSRNAYRIPSAVLKESSAEAESLNVSIALEPINRFDSDFLHTADEASGFIENTGCSNLGILLDTFHMNMESPPYSATGNATLWDEGWFVFNLDDGDSSQFIVSSDIVVDSLVKIEVFYDTEGNFPVTVTSHTVGGGPEIYNIKY